MNNPFKPALCLALAIPFALAACGGGGEAPKASMTPTPTEADRNGVATANSAKTLQSAREAADSLPRFGSVTQSNTRDANGITTDRARAAWDGAGLTVTITRADESTLTLDSSDAVDTAAAAIPSATRALGLPPASPKAPLPLPESRSHSTIRVTGLPLATGYTLPDKTFLPPPRPSRTPAWALSLTARSSARRQPCPPR